MIQLTENAQKAIKAIKETELGKFSAKALSEKCGYKVSPQTLAALAKKGILNKVEGTSPVEYTFIGEFEQGEGVSSVKNLANRYAQYKVLIENRVKQLVGEEAPKDYEYMFTLKGSYMEWIKWDTTGKNYPKVKPIMLQKKVDDVEAFKQAWNDLLPNFHMEVLD